MKHIVKGPVNQGPQIPLLYTLSLNGVLQMEQPFSMMVDDQDMGQASGH